MSAPRVQSPNTPGAGWTRKAAALFEVLGVFIGGSFAASWLAPRLGTPFPNLGSPRPDFVALSVAWLKFFLLQYACLLAPAFFIGWWRRRLKPRDYGLTRAGSRITALIAQGLLAFAFVMLPLQLLVLATQFIPLGPDPFMWTFVRQVDWTPAFWLFVAVSGFAVTSPLEEIFFRGYCQTRLEEDFGGIGAIAIVALFTALGHSQYHQLSALNVGIIACAMLSFLAIGWVYWRTRSLIPAVIIHGAMNVPTKAIWVFLMPAILIVVLVLFHQKWRNTVREFLAQASNPGWKVAAFSGAAVAIAMVIGFETRPDTLVPLSIVGLVVALIIELRWKLKNKARI
jgi:membrane protease YdiL (CAAX protease family)